MLSPLKLSILCVALTALGVLAAAWPAEKPQSGSNKPEPLPMDDFALFPVANQCRPDEQLAPGMLPTCEPSCTDPRPICPKIFFTGLDHVACFCKAPLVRNQKTKQCVPLKECPTIDRTGGQDRNTW